MSQKGKRKDDGYASDGGSDGQAEAAPPPRKAARQDSDDSGDIVACELSRNRRVTVRSWHGQVVVDVREFYVKDGKSLPGKKGISLPIDQWNKLVKYMPEIDKALADA
ncbi:RNA polymerase II transcriptional coactivator KIWI-like isoform X1 [Syzygium oleosum]|uniref:RNA polymerase II transcriptional coactivator KIWI-like isoform X1 n=1 Tax=Syzygium oleosum TaxID=219896 RepID=UPI0011D26474|nr:RNA polymerase II transcriptional coactivator KIWI-like isoform X1 [Syzygium oleosum]